MCLFMELINSHEYILSLKFACLSIQSCFFLLII